MANVNIDIAAEFVGKKAFKQADSATDKLTKNVKKLAGAFGIAFGTTQILAYGKAAVKAAAADQKAQQQLALALKNVGLERDAASTENYIQRLQSEFGIVDDLLRPAYQTLAVATRDSAESQRLLNLALDVSASTGKDLGAVTTALSRAYLGNNTALSRLGVGISKADLKSKSFYEITTQLADTFDGSATAAANTFQGSINKLGVAAANAQETIGIGLIDALKALSNDNSVDSLADDMERAALASADFIRGLGQIGSFQVSGETRSLIGLLTTPFKRSLAAGPLGAITRLGEASRIAPQPFATGMTISGQTQVKQQKQITKLTQQQATAQSKILKDKRLANAMDKANLALNKGSEVFDMDKIQIAAALTSQAEALGKATTSSQVLQIANDTARLNVKRSILALEDAIAAKDEAAIIAATAKLNADLKVLGALGQQDVKLQDIESILDTLKPKDLINLQNLKDAIAMLTQLLGMQATAAATTNGTAAAGVFGGGSTFSSKITSQTVAAAIAARTGYDISGATDPRVLYGGQRIDSAGNYNSFNAEMAYAMGAGRYQGSANTGNTIIVNTGVGDPNAIAEAIDQVLTDAVQRGTLRGVLATS